MTYNPQQPYYQQQQAPPYGPQTQYQQQFHYQPPEQTYAHQVPNYNPQVNYSAPQDSLDFTQTFKVEEPKYHDLWATISFACTVAGFIAVSVLSISGNDIGSSRDKTIYRTETVSLNTNTIILFAFVLCIAFVTSLSYFWVIRTFTKQAIWITGILQIVFGLATAFYYFTRHWLSAGIAYLVFSIFYIICFISWIPRIPFSVLMLQTIIDVSKSYGHVFWISLIGGFTATTFAAWFSVTMVSIYVKYYPGNKACTANGSSCSQGKVIGLLIFITFAGYWITEVIKNIIHVSISGVYGSWYFCSKKPGGFPKGSTRGAFKRAMTYSFGSISFGSLLVAIVQVLRQACSIATQNEAAEGNIFGMCFFCCLQYLIGILDWAIQFLNEYAFSYIALYGKSYIKAAKATWKMMIDRGVDAIVNECLINPVLTMGAVFVAYLSSLFAFLYLQFTRPSYNDGNAFTIVVMAFAFLIGLQIANVFLVPIKSGVATFFVAMAFDPQVLILEYPDLWQQMIQVYPHIQAAIHV
ncbi:putative protein pns1 [Erysiphe necator]|uniref:Protein PNS1 n=1 Tax=Uncinula necator TaxID=52586 RepID=A0A0B1PDC5_UNCNE|nr:putative protein pns1 [Erysiphe necator]